jgi:hypothetical protein
MALMNATTGAKIIVAMSVRDASRKPDARIGGGNIRLIATGLTMMGRLVATIGKPRRASLEPDG